MWLRKRRIGCLALTTLLLIVLIPVGFFWLWLATSGDHWSEDEAARLSAIVNKIETPEAGKGTPGFAFQRFKSGEWVLGVGLDSHGWMSKFRGGGMLVVKDSQGRVRYFLGHVCGPDGAEFFFHDAQTLDQFYERLFEPYRLVELVHGSK